MVDKFAEPCRRKLTRPAGTLERLRARWCHFTSTTPAKTRTGPSNVLYLWVRIAMTRRPCVRWGMGEWYHPTFITSNAEGLFYRNNFYFIFCYFLIRALFSMALYFIISFSSTTPKFIYYPSVDTVTLA